MNLIIDTNIKPITQLEAIHSFIVFPEDLNYHNTLFGGKVLAEMDLAAVKVTRRLLYGTQCDGAVTASLNRVDFKRPAHLGDIIEMRAVIKKLGTTSIEIDVFVSKENQQGKIETICEATFVFVSLRAGKPFPHGCVFRGS